MRKCRVDDLQLNMQSFAQILAAPCLAISCLIGMYIALRTLGIWRKTRQVAELTIGLNMLSISVAGVIIAIYVATPGLRENAASWPLHLTMLAGLVTHVMALSIGTWKIFRGGEQWPIAIVICAALSMLGYVGVSIGIPLAESLRTGIYETTRLVIFAWTAFECVRYRGLMQKRLALGLADPAIIHRIGLWGIASFAQVVVTGLGITQVLTGDTLISSTSVLFISSLLGLIGSVCIGLAFFPPHWYTDRIFGPQPTGE